MSIKNNSKKRTATDAEIVGISPTLTNKWAKDFKKNPINLIARNAVVSVGSEFATIDEEEVKNTSHIFMNTIKSHNLKATDQGQSGRCWIFAGLNMFRHLFIKTLGLNQFEFSVPYLFFWDKLERSNYYLEWFMNNKADINSRDYEYMLDSYYSSDGGYWNQFVSLVKKYGVIPLSAMPETFQSENSADMNELMNEHLVGAACWFHNNSEKSLKEKNKVKFQVLKNIYNLLVKYLGQPPQSFTWYFNHYDHDTETDVGDATKSSPKEFTDMIFPKKLLQIDDFVLLGNMPSLPYGQMYEGRLTANLVGGQNNHYLNLPITELKKYALKSILAGLPVWFAGDVRKGFNYFHSVLNPKLYNNSLLFGKTLPMNKAERLNFRATAACHAMVLVGVNLDGKQTTEWQVENSWGFRDNSEPGKDGFLSMKDEWFDEYLYEVVINKKFLTKAHQKMLTQERHQLEPWDTRCLKVTPK